MNTEQGHIFIYTQRQTHSKTAAVANRPQAKLNYSLSHPIRLLRRLTNRHAELGCSPLPFLSIYFRKEALPERITLFHSPTGLNFCLVLVRPLKGLSLVVLFMFVRWYVTEITYDYFCISSALFLHYELPSSHCNLHCFIRLNWSSSLRHMMVRKDRCFTKASGFFL